MTFEEAEKLPKGTLIKFIGAGSTTRGYNARVGATAKKDKVDSHTGNIWVEWIRNGLDSNQFDGDYSPECFELLENNEPETKSLFLLKISLPCNCSPFDFSRFGCQFLQKADSKGFLHH